MELLECCVVLRGDGSAVLQPSRVKHRRLHPGEREEGISDSECYYTHKQSHLPLLSAASPELPCQVPNDIDCVPVLLVEDKLAVLVLPSRPPRVPFIRRACEGEREEGGGGGGRERGGRRERGGEEGERGGGRDGGRERWGEGERGGGREGGGGRERGGMESEEWKSFKLYSHVKLQV